MYNIFTSSLSLSHTHKEEGEECNKDTGSNFHDLQTQKYNLVFNGLKTLHFVH